MNLYLRPPLGVDHNWGYTHTHIPSLPLHLHYWHRNVWPEHEQQCSCIRGEVIIVKIIIHKHNILLTKSPQSLQCWGLSRWTVLRWHQLDFVSGQWWPACGQNSVLYVHTTQWSILTVFSIGVNITSFAAPAIKSQSSVCWPLPAWNEPSSIGSTPLPGVLPGILAWTRKPRIPSFPTRRTRKNNTTIYCLKKGDSSITRLYTATHLCKQC